MDDLGQLQSILELRLAVRTTYSFRISPLDLTHKVKMAIANMMAKRYAEETSKKFMIIFVHISTSSLYLKPCQLYRYF